MKNISMVSAQTLLILHIQSPIIAMQNCFLLPKKQDDDDDCLGKLDEERDGLDKYRRRVCGKLISSWTHPPSVFIVQPPVLPQYLSYFNPQYCCSIYHSSTPQYCRSIYHSSTPSIAAVFIIVQPPVLPQYSS